jgi:hypothetical protein
MIVLILLGARPRSAPPKATVPDAGLSAQLLEVLVEAVSGIVDSVIGRTAAGSFRSSAPSSSS